MDIQTLQQVLAAVNEKVKQASALKDDDFKIGAQAALGGCQQMLENMIEFESKIRDAQEVA